MLELNEIESAAFLPVYVRKSFSQPGLHGQKRHRLTDSYQFYRLLQHTVFCLLCLKVGDVNIVKALIVFGADVNAVNIKNETPRHLATVSKSRFRNQIIHALCLVGAAPCDPRKCNYQCNVPFKPSNYGVGKFVLKFDFNAESSLKFAAKNSPKHPHFFCFLNNSIRTWKRIIKEA